MSVEPPIATWTRAAKLRGAADDLAVGAPIAIVAIVLAGRLDGWPIAAGVAVAAAPGLVLAARIRSRRYGRAWLVSRLNAARGDLDDSADLLLVEPDRLAPVQRLQRARVAARLADSPTDLRPAWSFRALAVTWAAGLAATIAILAWPAPPRSLPLAPSTEGVAAAPGIPRLVAQRLTIVPPAYTGLPRSDLPSLDVRMPQGSRLVWTLAFAPQPESAALTFLDGRRLPLVRLEAQWQAATMLDRSGLYRVVPAGGALPPRLHRIDVIADQPPVVTAVLPDRTLTLASAGQRGWPIAFTATDDYGVAPAAQLRVTVATGTGEQVSFREHLLTLHATGPARNRRFAATLNLAGLGFTGPGDLVAQLIVADTRAPAPQLARSPSVILRRQTPEATGATGLEGLMRSALPTALRSQRQVVNDAEALLRQRRTLSQAGFAARSESIGGDQASLRSHYGALLGEESEGAASELPTSDAPAAKPVGRESDVMAQFGEEKEDPEANTLYDPPTHAKLQAVVDLMWRSETALRSGDPTAALPFARQALVLLKQVQQATRVFVQKLSAPQLPPIDEARRLTGKREGIVADPLALAPRPNDARGDTAAWAAVSGLPGGLGDPGNIKSGDPLALAEARDRVRREPGCAACRVRLRALVWAATVRPPVGVARRDAGDPAGRRYLEAISR